MSIPKIQKYSLEGVIHSALNQTDWKIDPRRAMLLVHDMQNYFINFYDANQSPAKEIIANISRIKQLCKVQNIPVVYTAQPGDQAPRDRALLTDFWGPGLANKQDIVAVVEDLKPDSEDILLTKWRYSAFQRTDLQQRMKELGRDQLIICGVYAHIGILATSLEAFMTDIKAFVIADAIADFSRKDHEMALGYISSRCGQVCDTQGLVEWFHLEKTGGNISRESMLDDVLNILGLDACEITTSDDLMYAGLDSIQLMSLVSKWEKLVPGLNFSMLAHVMTIDEWYSIVRDLQDTRKSKPISADLSADSL